MDDVVATARFDPPSLIEGTEPAGRTLDLPAEIAIDLRTAGLRVHVDQCQTARRATCSTAPQWRRSRPSDL